MRPNSGWLPPPPAIRCGRRFRERAEGGKAMIGRAFIGAAMAALALPAIAQDAYVVGVTGAMTGPAAGTNAPSVDGLRLYADKLNAAGGINGKQIRLVLQDDQG